MYMFSINSSIVISEEYTHINISLRLGDFLLYLLGGNWGTNCNLSTGGNSDGGRSDVG